MPEFLKLKGVGFWRSAAVCSAFLCCPRPQWFVCPGWHASERSNILQYLRAGVQACTFGGISDCCFRFCRENGIGGTHRYTDGEWFWPESLPHYVECHAVSLPEEFVNSMRLRSWRVPELPEQFFGPGGIQSQGDYTFWLAWATQLAETIVTLASDAPAIPSNHPLSRRFTPALK